MRVPASVYPSEQRTGIRGLGSSPPPLGSGEFSLRYDPSLLGPPAQVSLDPCPGRKGVLSQGPTLTVLTGLAVEAGAAAAGARGGLAGALVEAGARQAAGGAVTARGAGCGERQVSPSPAVRRPRQPPRHCPDSGDPGADPQPHRTRRLAARHSPCSQCGPVQPRPQEQLPLVGWHRPPCWQVHWCSQLAPNRCWGHSRERGRTPLELGPRLDTEDPSPPARHPFNHFPGPLRPSLQRAHVSCPSVHPFRPDPELRSLRARA